MAPWRPSPNMYKGRAGPLRWIVWHSTESSEVTGGAMNVAAGWFAKPASRASAHIVADAGEVVECVKPGDTAWHAARANSSGYGIEIVGRAGQGADAWSDPYSLAAIRNACRWINRIPILAGIPRRWLTDAQLRSKESGHITHAQVSRVLGGTNHTDPGPGFPFAYVMEQLKDAQPGPADANPVLRLTDPMMRGEAVASLQTFLNAHFPSYSQLAVDGIYGPATVVVIKELQRRVGLAADGIVGPVTWSALTRLGM